MESELEAGVPAEVTESRIVEGVGISANVGGKKTELATRVEAAMAQAVLDAHAEGINDAYEIRTRMLAARDAEVDDHHEADRVASAEASKV